MRAEVPAMKGTNMNTHAPIDWTGRIKELERTVSKTTKTEEQGHGGRKTVEREKRDEANWRVNWEEVKKTEEWIEKERAAGRWGFTGHPGAYDILPSAVPEEVGQIGGVLLSRCAGYAKPPRPREVAAAVRSQTPSTEQWDALAAYLQEATATEVKTACQAGEIELRKLMQRVEEMMERTGMYGLRSVEQWLKI